MIKAASLVFVSLLSGCVMYQGERTPNLIESQGLPSITAAPRIEVILRHRHTMDGSDVGEGASGPTMNSFRESFERVRAEAPFLANAGFSLAKPDLVLDLDTENAEHGRVWAMVTGASLLVIPGFMSADLIVKAKLTRPDGTVISEHEGNGKLKMISHLLFLPMLPVTLALAPGDELVDDTFRDVFIQMAPDIEKNAPAP